MIRTLKRYVEPDGKEYVELSMDSDDVKPTEHISGGSIVSETDTGKVYFYDEDEGDWVEQFSFQ